MRWVIGQFQHETNTFSNIHPGRAEFAERELLFGHDIPKHHRGVNSVPGGFVDFIEKHGIEPVYPVSAFATPAGPVKAAFFRWTLAEILKAITPDVDGVLLGLHGAMVVEDADDGEGAVLAAVRERLGPDKPIAVALDYHTNLSPAMVENADILVGYKTYPHVDLHDTGLAAARLLLRCAKGEVRPTRAAAYPAILAPLGNTSTLGEPMGSMLARARAMEREPGVLSVSVFGGFPYADIAIAGMCALVITDNDPAGAARRVKEFGDGLWATRKSFLCAGVPVAEAVKQAIASKEGPVVLADVADNPGGGGAGDGVEILRELIAQKAPDAAVGTIWDPAAAEVCRKAGVGAEVTLTLGAKTDAFHGKPVEVTGKVVRLGDGHYTYEGPMNTGLSASMGPTAVLRSGGVDVIINSFRAQNLDLSYFRSNGIEPTARKVLVVKSSIHFRGAYGLIAKRIIEVDAPGLVSPNMKRFDFKKVRRPIFPLDSL